MYGHSPEKKNIQTGFNSQGNVRVSATFFRFTHKNAVPCSILKKARGF
jgi:hypothetical protein